MGKQVPGIKPAEITVLTKPSSYDFQWKSMNESSENQEVILWNS